MYFVQLLLEFADEMRIINSTFCSPFFRTEQLIVRPTNQEFIAVIDPQTFEEVYYGPVFNETLLEKVRWFAIF